MVRAAANLRESIQSGSHQVGETMHIYTTSGANFGYVPSDGGTINVNGYVFRAVPHSSQEPLSTAFSYAAGGRWNAAGTAPVLYTAGNIATARAFVNWQA